MKSILFVCLGNICRSPLAEGIAKKLNSEYYIDSCGTGSWHIGETPCANSIKIASQHGIDISRYRARQFSSEDIARFDHIIALDESNLNDLKLLGATNAIKLGSFGYDNMDVPDPYFFNGFEGFEKVYAMIHDCVEQLLHELETK